MTNDPGLQKRNSRLFSCGVLKKNSDGPARSYRRKSAERSGFGGCVRSIQGRWLRSVAGRRLALQARLRMWIDASADCMGLG